MFHVSVTGHRPDKIGGYAPCAQHRAIRRHMKELLIELQTKNGDVTIYSGGALGIDQFWMEVGHFLKMPVVAILPFPDFDSLWPSSSRQNLKKLLDKCVEIRYHTPVRLYTKPEVVKALFGRNIDLIQACDLLVAYWDGTKGGTAHAVRLARQGDKLTLVFNPEEMK